VNPTSKRLLFVDDEPHIRETLSIILPRYGFTVTLAATVAEALEHIRKQQFDVLLCDLNIEGERDGYKIVRAIRAIDPSCIVVVLTAYPNMESAIEGIRHGINDYLIKPSTAEMLVHMLTERLAKRQADQNPRPPPFLT
jgi:DNA-binding NtrC family response regulator